MLPALFPTSGNFPVTQHNTHAQLEGETHRWGLHRERAKKKERKILPLETPAFHVAVSTIPLSFARAHQTTARGVGGTVSLLNFTKFFPFSLFFSFFCPRLYPLNDRGNNRTTSWDRRLKGISIKILCRNWGETKKPGKEPPPVKR